MMQLTLQQVHTVAVQGSTDKIDLAETFKEMALQERLHAQTHTPGGTRS